MQAGKALEHLVAAIQEHLKDNPNAKVTLNEKLPNRSGNKREIDVFVQTKVNGENIGIAFECKDYKRKVTEPTIDAFWAKINDLPQVHKGIIVTTTGYTKGAQKEAKSHNIGLYLIDDLPLNEIIPNHNFYSARVLVYPLLNALELHTILDVTNVTFAPEARFKYITNGEDVELALEIYKAIYDTKLLCELAAKYMEVGKKPLIMVVKITPNPQLYIEDVKGVKYEINYLRIPVQIDLILEECQISSKKRYATLDNNNVVSVSEYDNNLNENAWVIVESDKEKNSCYIKINGRYYKPDIVISGISEKKIQTCLEN
jgi:hypothetical protein